jgi:AcrR family transcriptional regulator
LTRDITDEARRQLEAAGASALSLRAVARELGMASSALYRYFASRDDLLTAMIVDAYDALGEVAEAADATRVRGDIAGRWRAVCAAVRSWALAHPHEYALVYGSPVPGYRAPERTIIPASRITVVLAAVVRDAAAAGVLAAGDVGWALEEPLAADAARVADTAMPGVPPHAVVRGLIAWTQLFGIVSFELFGHLTGVVEAPEAFFNASVAMVGTFVGLPGDPGPA